MNELPTILREDWAVMFAEVRAILEEADRDIAARRPVCQVSGKCCKFEEYGHRLYVTRAELIYFAHTERAAAPQADGSTGRGVSLPQFFQTDRACGCPYQIDGLCTAREGRPLGCRVYFCDAAAQAWLNDVYEKYHARLQAVHAKYKLAYEYMEWRAGLRLLSEGKV